MTRLSVIRRQETTPNRTKGGRKAFRGLVLHIAEGSYEGTISWQKNPTSKVSSEFVIGRKPGEWAQMMDLNDYGWTQRDGNGYWVASENAGYVADGLSDWQVEANAQLLAWLHVHKGVPLQVTDTPAKHGLGHHSMGAENGYDWGHPSCPGARVRSRKSEIVARAKQIINGEDDLPMDQATFDKLLANALKPGSPARIAIGAAAHQQTVFRTGESAHAWWFGKIPESIIEVNKKLDVLAANAGGAVAEQVAAIRDEMRAVREEAARRGAELLAAVDQVDEQTAARLGGRPATEVAAALVAAGQDPRELAEALNALAQG